MAVEYVIARAAYGRISPVQDLEAAVNHLTQQGWIPIGGIGFCDGVGYQALIRVVDERKTEHDDGRTDEV